jgi:G3E family GTPase
MKIIVLGGFLGSGKTSILLPLLRHLVAKGGSGDSRKVAVIENEIGEISIDGPAVQRNGIQVTDMLSGCICCSLSSDLVSGIIDIQKAFDPEWVVIETTGLAYPNKAAELIKTYIPSTPVKTVVMVDAYRWEELVDVLEPLMKGQLSSADTIVLNKIDRVSGEQGDAVAGDLRQLNPRATILRVSALRGLDASALESMLPD